MVAGLRPRVRAICLTDTPGRITAVDEICGLPPEETPARYGSLGVAGAALGPDEASCKLMRIVEAPTNEA